MHVLGDETLHLLESLSSEHHGDVEGERARLGPTARPHQGLLALDVLLQEAAINTATA